MAKKAPRSYKNSRRPPLQEALALEGNIPIALATDSLIKKGYFTARPRPWQLGFSDRGHGHGDFGIIDRFGDLVVGKLDKETAELIIKAVNQFKEK